VHRGTVPTKMTLDNATVTVYIGHEMDDRFGIENLAELGGVTRRTIRYYVQERLLPPPLGVGRGRHYGSAHLERLLFVKSLQEEGLPLAEIRRRVLEPNSAEGASDLFKISRASWTRLMLLPGVELHVAGDVRLPPPSKLGELSDWCRRHLRRKEDVDGYD
jgi:DNA-binding transcriptional MerR regulator